MKKFLSVGALVVLASCTWTKEQYGNFTDWSGRQFDSAGHAVSTAADDVTPSKNDFVIKNHYEGYPYDNSKVMTDGQTMKAVKPTYNTTPAVGKNVPLTTIVDPKDNIPTLPGEGVSSK